MNTAFFSHHSLFYTPVLMALQNFLSIKYHFNQFIVLSNLSDVPLQLLLINSLLEYLFMLPTPMMGQLIEYGAFLSSLALSFSLSHAQKGRRAEEAACTYFSFYITPALSTSNRITSFLVYERGGIY